MQSEYRLSEANHAGILRLYALPDVGLEGVVSHEQPRAVILAGQPGSGQRAFARSAEVECRNDILKIDADELREHHPEFESLRQRFPYAWTAHTQHDATQWLRQLGMAAIDARKNIIVDTTLGDRNGVIRTIRVLQLCIPSAEPNPCSATGA